MLESLPAEDRVIIIYGLSGSGKSTVASALGRLLGLRVVHPSSILRDLMAGSKVNTSKTRYGRGFWESGRGLALLKGRLSEERPMDLVCDEFLKKEINIGNLVMDSWNMAWLSKRGIKIYLRSSAKTRAKRVAHRGGLTHAAARSAIRIKDVGTRKLFKRLYDIDIVKDLKVFDLIIDTEKINKKEVVKKILEFLQKI